MLLKEVVGGKGGPSGSQQTKVVAGSQTKGVTRKARKTMTLGKSKFHCYPFVTEGGSQNQGSLRYSNGSRLPVLLVYCARHRRPSGAVLMCYVLALTLTT